MINNNSNHAIDSMSMIRIVGLNTDKTRRASGSFTVYHVYFELSEHPPAAWRSIFGREWTNLNAKQKAGIDGKFLVLHCPLQEVETIQLPALKEAVEATKTSHISNMLGNGSWKKSAKPMCGRKSARMSKIWAGR